MFLALVFTACLGGQCREVQIPWDGSLQSCMLFGQQQIAAYLREHPGYVKSGGYRCTSGSAA